MNSDLSGLAQAFVLGAFPWVSQLRQLDIHFKRGDYDCAAVFNLFASLFACAFFMYSRQAHPTQFVAWPAWYYFLAAAFLFTVAYFVLFILGRDRVKEGKWTPAIVVNFVLYVSIFVALTSGFGLLRLFEPYVVIRGTVVDETGAPLTAVDVELSNPEGYARSTVTDDRGGFVILVEKDALNEITRGVFTTHNGDRNRQVTFAGGFSVPVTLRRVVMPRS